MRRVIKETLKFFPPSFKNFLRPVRNDADAQYLKKEHVIKQLTIKKYQAKYKSDTLIETGTYMGDMVFAQLNVFKKIFSIELGEDLWSKAVERFKDYSHVNILHGDSGIVLKEVIPQLNNIAIFWLDGHYSAGITAKGDKECPIYEELTAIFKSKLNHILLIDDARLFNGQNDYPAYEDLSAFILSERPLSTMQIKDDIIRVVLQ